jgi:hypothetical protein
MKAILSLVGVAVLPFGFVVLAIAGIGYLLAKRYPDKTWWPAWLSARPFQRSASQ